MNRLVAVNKTEHGMYLAETEGSSEKVLLPGKELQSLSAGEPVEVFLYKDSSDRLIATREKPLIMLHEVAKLTVSDVGKIGAFVNWGLPKDLLLPFREQTKKVQKGEEVLVALYVDKTGRLALTMNVYEYLQTDSPYHKDDKVMARIYLVSKNFGAFAAVDDRYSALIPRKELAKDPAVGDRIECRIVEVLDDGKLTLSIREKSYAQMDTDAERIAEAIRERNGRLPFNDKADPELIRQEFAMSKAQFKRAVGRLYKERRIDILEDAIILKE
ncbi:MAG: S1 RNA-binding domain-containing protein [Lachnospiraceae bacterium]|nr:S1 RNA-binding domain-containing protein [Lachnospiraceae bacterium]